MRSPACLCPCLCLLLATLYSFDSLCAATIYVDNRVGSDAFDGQSAKPLESIVGPLRSLRAAMQKAGPGDTIELANNGTPYFGSATLAGPRHSALGGSRLTIDGHGAVLDGSQPVPSHAWKEVEGRLWKMTPWRKGHYQLVLDGNPVPEQASQAGTEGLQELPEGHWSAVGGSIYYRGAAGEDPRERPFRFARDSVGLTLYGVRGVTIRNLSLRHFRLDGISLPNDCRDVLLENVRASANARAGLFAGGSSQVFVRGAEISDNREHQVLISGLAVVRLVDSELSEPPTIKD